MKRLIIALTLLSFFASTFAQNEPSSFTTEEFVAGKNLLTNQDIKGIRYVFQKKIISFDLDSASNMLFIHTLRYGDFQKLSAIDPTQKTIVWSLNFNGYSECIFLKKGMLIHNKQQEAICHDIRSGKELWSTQCQFYLSDFKNKIGIGYPNPGFFSLSNKYTDEAKGIDLQTGKVIWERTIPRRNFWENWQYNSDSTLLIVCKGLHYINLKTGKGWDNYDKTETDVFNHNLTSCVYSDSLKLYWASMNNLWCLDKTGKAIWQTSLDPAITGESVLLKSDSLICLLNYGSCHNDQDKDCSYGMPYIAQFSTETGSQKHFQSLQYKSKYISDYSIKEDTIGICYSNRIAIYNLNDLSLIKEKEFKLKSKDNFVHFAGFWRYAKDDNGTIKPINKIDTTQIKYTLVTKYFSVVGFNKELEQVRCWKPEDLYTLQYKNKKYTILSKNNQIIVLTPEGKVVAEFSTGKDIRIQNNILYYSDQTNLYCCDLSGISELNVKDLN